MDDLTRQVQDTVADVRRLVYGLRPPAVDDLGLIGAIKEQAQAMGGVEVHGTVDEDLPAAVEVAAYRIALEAMTNSLRHGAGRWCRVGLELDGNLHIVIEDDGVGLPEQSAPGSGSPRCANAPANSAAPGRSRAATPRGPWSWPSFPWRRRHDNRSGNDPNLGRSTIRALIADDHPVFRSGLRTMVEDAADLEFAGEASDGQEALELCRAAPPDVVLMDLRMPGTSGVAATAALAAELPAVRVLMLTMLEDDTSLVPALRAGARGYVLKGAAPAEILRAVRAVAAGQAIFDVGLADRLAGLVVGKAGQRPYPFPELSRREHDVLHLLAAGHSTTAIAAQLSLSEKTVRNNVSTVLVKLRATDRPAAIIRAREAGIATRPPSPHPRTESPKRNVEAPRPVHVTGTVPVQFAAAHGPIDDLVVTVTPTSSKRMRLRYPGSCRDCARPIPAGQWAVYHRLAKTVHCLSCCDLEVRAGTGGIRPEIPAVPTSADPVSPPPVDTGTAGASARREYERRAANRETRIRAAHPRVGGLVMALRDEPQHITAWGRGAGGERMLGTRLDALCAQGVLVLHDRGIPRSRANIDHVVISAAGVFVIDAKRYRGRPHLRVEGGVLRPQTETLLVGGRNGTKLLSGVAAQVDRVRAGLAAGGFTGAPVRGVLCFVEADWPWLGGTFTTAGIAVVHPKKLTAMITAAGSLTTDAMTTMHRHLAAAFPPA